MARSDSKSNQRAAKSSIALSPQDLGYDGISFPAFATFGDISSDSEDGPMAKPLETVDKGGMNSMNVSYSHRVTVVAYRQVKGNLVFLLRLLDVSRFTCSYCVKRPEQLVKLLAKLQEDLQNSWGGNSQVGVLPEKMFSFKKKFMGNTFESMKEDIQTAFDLIMCQIQDLSNCETMCDFFRDTKYADMEKSVYDWVIAEKETTTLVKMVGFWRLKGSRRLWTLYADGRAFLDGRHRGDMYDLKEEGENLERKIIRPDAWLIDVDSSNKDKLVWYCPGKSTLAWHRIPEQEAEHQLGKIINSKDKKKG